MRIAIIFIALLFTKCNSQKIYQAKPYQNFSGAVSNDSIALNIAIANWLPLYGKRIFKAEPFNARIDKDSIWIVTGSLKKGREGGVPYIEINKFNGRVLKISHSR